MEYEEYLKRREELLGIRMDSFSSFDKSILSLSTGSLALSVTFLEKIGAPFNRLTFTLICLAWFSFFLVIIFNLASYHFARWNMDRKIEDLDQRYRTELTTETPDTSPEPFFWQNRATSHCNSGALITFCAGVLFFVVYIVNIQVRNFEQLQATVTKEVTMPGKQLILNEGKTETSRAVSRTEKPSFRPHDGSNTRGATESPQAVLRPANITFGKTESPQAVLRPASSSDSSSGTPK